MDPSSPYAMQSLIGLKDQFDVAFACDTDHDRHGIVTKSAGLMPPNHYLAVCIHYLFRIAHGWRGGRGGREDRGQQQHDRSRGGEAGAAAVRSAGGIQIFRGRAAERLAGIRRRGERRRSFLRRDGIGLDDGQGRHDRGAAGGRDHRADWATIRARVYRRLTSEFGAPVYERIDAPANAEQERGSANCRRRHSGVGAGGEKIEDSADHAPGDGNAIGGIKVAAASGWFAARPREPRTFIRSTRRAFAAPSTCSEFRAKPRRLWGRRSRRG